MRELINEISIRRDSIPITDLNSLVNETRDTFFTSIDATDSVNTEDFFDLDLSYFNIQED